MEVIMVHFQFDIFILFKETKVKISKREQVCAPYWRSVVLPVSAWLSAPSCGECCHCSHVHSQFIVYSVLWGIKRHTAPVLACCKSTLTLWPLWELIRPLLEVYKYSARNVWESQKIHSVSGLRIRDYVCHNRSLWQMQSPWKAVSPSCFHFWASWGHQEGRCVKIPMFLRPNRRGACCHVQFLSVKWAVYSTIMLTKLLIMFPLFLLNVLNKTNTSCNCFCFHVHGNTERTESGLLLQAVGITQTEISSELYVCSVG